MKWMDDGIRDILHLPADERAKLKRLDEAIQGKMKKSWLSWWGLILLGVGIAAKWINPLFAIVVYVTFIGYKKVICVLAGSGETMLNEYESLQRQNEKLKADRDKRTEEEKTELLATVRAGKNVQDHAESRIGTIGFGRNSEDEE